MLSNQDKLALALTSAGSQRALAKIMGVSHQKIGRWLREGQPAIVDPTTGYQIRQAGAREIPDAATPLIDLAFTIHRDISKAQAVEDGIPFNPYAPTYDRKGIKRDGEKGDRVFTENTEFIKPELRTEILQDKQKSKKYLQASVRSTINIKRYFEKVAQDEIEKYKRKRTNKKKLGKQIMDSFLKANNKIIESDELMPLFTQYENISPGTDTRRSVEQINKKLKVKHEANASSLADQFLFQLIPTPQRSNREKTRQPKPAGSRKAKK